MDNPPPIPPRRRKRKTDVRGTSMPKVATKTIAVEKKTSVHNGILTMKDKPRPLPPAPTLSENVIPCKRMPRLVQRNCEPSTTAIDSHLISSKFGSAAVKLQSESAIQASDSVTANSDCTITKEENNKKISATEKFNSESSSNFSIANLDCPVQNHSGRSSPMPRNHSPFFFTFRDFESVMEHSSKCDKTSIEQYKFITSPSDDISEFNPTSIDNTMLDDCNEDENDEEVYFRVTTTNVPFEKCLGDWDAERESDNFSSQFENANNDYIFEDYMDRSKRLNARAAAGAFLYTNENFDSNEPIVRSATKVRFVIESPNHSLTNLNYATTILTDIEAEFNEEESIDKNSVIITEITDTPHEFVHTENVEQESNPDEFGDVPFGSLIENELQSNNNCDMNENTQDGTTVEKLVNDNKFEKACKLEEPNTRSRRSTPSPRFKSPKRREFDPFPDINDIIVPNLPPTYDPRDEGFIKKEWELKIDSPQKTPQKSVMSEESRSAKEAFISKKFDTDSNHYHETTSPEPDPSYTQGNNLCKSEITQKKNLGSPPLRSFSIEMDNLDWKDFSYEENEKGKDKNFAPEISQFRINSQNEETLVESCNYDEEQDIFSDNLQRSFYSSNNEENDKNKSINTRESEMKASSDTRHFGNNIQFSLDMEEPVYVPVTVRRNSFLENMLSNDGSLDAPASCLIVATHLKSDPLPIIPATVPTMIEQKFHPANLDRFADRKQNECKEANRSCDNLKNGSTIGIDPKTKTVKVEGSALPTDIQKSQGEKKSDVLSELLNNFSAIKLKSVEPVTREFFWSDNTISEELNAGIVSGTTSSTPIINIQETWNVDTVMSTEKRYEKSSEIKNSSQSVSVIREDGNTSQRRDSKGAVVVIEHMEDRQMRNSENSAKNEDTNRERTLDNSKTIVRCAIDRNNHEIQRNDNDNNAMRHVEVSNDQKSWEAAEISTIAPGSVRNFVELYEIQHEKTSEHSKSNYSLPIAKSRSKTKCFKGLGKNANYGAENPRRSIESDNNCENYYNNGNVQNIASVNTKLSEVSLDVKMTKPEVRARGKPIKVDDDLNIMQMASETRESENGDSQKNEFLGINNSMCQPRQIPVAAKRRSQDSCLKMTNKLSPRSESKKTVTFCNDDGITKSEDNATDLHSDKKIGVRPKTPKRRAPEGPINESSTTESHSTTRTIEKHDLTLNISNRKTESESQIPTPALRTFANLSPTKMNQIKVEQDSKDCPSKAGIPSSTPRSDVPHLQQPYVFYCKV